MGQKKPSPSVKHNANIKPLPEFGKLFFILSKNRFAADTFQSAYFTGQCRNNILRRINGNADNRNLFLFVWDSHTTDNISAVFMQQGVKFFNAILIFYQNSKQCNAGFHIYSP